MSFDRLDKSNVTPSNFVKIVYLYWLGSVDNYENTNLHKYLQNRSNSIIFNIHMTHLSTI